MVYVFVFFLFFFAERVLCILVRQFLEGLLIAIPTISVPVGRNRGYLTRRTIQFQFNSIQKFLLPQITSTFTTYIHRGILRQRDDYVSFGLGTCIFQLPPFKTSMNTCDCRVRP